MYPNLYLKSEDEDEDEDDIVIQRKVGFILRKVRIHCFIMKISPSVYLKKKGEQGKRSDEGTSWTQGWITGVDIERNKWSAFRTQIRLYVHNDTRLKWSRVQQYE